MTKFRENRHEKLERLVELHDKYTQKSKQSLEKLDRMNHTELNGNGVTGDDNYLEKYDAGLSICQLIACLIIRVYNMKYEVGLCLLLLIKNKGVDIQDIYNHLLGIHTQLYYSIYSIFTLFWGYFSFILVVF